MNDWQVVPKQKMVSGVKFRLRGAGKKLAVYLGVELRKRIKGYRPDEWCNVYQKANSLMIQLVDSPDTDSRKIKNSIFTLPYSVVEGHWKGGCGEADIPVIVEKDNLILVDLRDLGK